MPMAYKFGVIAHYEIEKTYYINVLCENKGKPELNCEGRCKLNQELKMTDVAEEQEPTALSGTTIKIEVSSFLLTNPLSIYAITKNIFNKLSFCSEDNLQIGFYSSVFHPPRF